MARAKRAARVETPTEASAVQPGVARRIEKLVRLPIGNVHEFAHGNPRTMHDTMQSALARSLEEFGVVEPIVVRARSAGGYEILNGHHRLDALKARGETEIDAVVVDLPDDKKARALVLALNKIAADWDYSALASYLSAWNGEGELDQGWLASVTGFNPDELRILESLNTESQSANAPDAVPDPEFKRYDEDAANDVKTIACPYCNKLVPLP